MAADGTFVLQVPFGEANYTLRARSGGAAGLFLDGPDVRIQVDLEDVAGITLPGRGAAK
ncbi:MAG: hypothetical protein ABIP94_14010 [Planctomycetota bacterium]